MPHVVALTFAAALMFAQAADGVTVTTDATRYAPGDAIQVSVTNGGPDRISRSGLDCDDLWPLALEQLDANGNWQPFAVPRHQCIGAMGVIIAPGDTQTRTISIPLDPGTYRVTYMFNDLDTGAQDESISDPFDVVPNTPLPE